MSSSLVSEIAKIPVLKGQPDYREWAIEVQCLARSLFLWDAIKDSDSGDEKDVHMREEKAIGLITRTLSTHLKIEVLNLPTTKMKEEEVTEGEGDAARVCIKATPSEHPITAARIWTHLQDKFEKKNGVSAAFDYQRFVQMGFVDDGNIREQIEKHMDLRARLELNYFILSDWHYATHILISLPPSFDAIRDYFLTTFEPNHLKLDDVLKRVFDKDERQKDAAAGLSVFQTGDRQPGNNKGKKRQNKRGGTGKDREKCLRCDRKGHWARDCYSKTKVDGTPLQPKGDPPPKPNQSSALNVVANADAESDSPVCWYLGAPENWLMDSGATDHMTPFGTDFIGGSYVRYDESRNVILGDGSTTLSIRGKGSVRRWIETSPQVYTEISLLDVLHVDDIK